VSGANKKQKTFKLGGNIGLGHKLEDGLAELIRIYAEDNDEEYFKARAVAPSPTPFVYLPVSLVTVKSTDLAVEILMGDAAYYYANKYVLATSKHFHEVEKDPIKAAKYRWKISSTREIRQDVIHEIASLFVEQGGRVRE